MKNRATENPFTHHRDTEIAENCFVFAHGETAMAKDISCPKGRNFSPASTPADEKIKSSVPSVTLWLDRLRA
jgi:hypothetical protein